MEPADFNEVGANINSSSEKVKASEQTDQSSDLDLISADSRVIVTLTDRGTQKVNVIKKIRFTQDFTCSLGNPMVPFDGCLLLFFSLKCKKP
ncbi:hypothetical protein [Acetivibrio cellulolyticus]|uniref:hypothetical protein n=1 Tax=Acetivibrio cellulolyticus TaxID=35830 RepID=UPI0001E2E6F2|nr:hypothetical protein [Acetivibrio cellulolyticus]